MTRISVLAIILIMLTGCSLFIKGDPVDLIEVQEVEDKLNAGDSFILVIANRAQCAPCESYLKGGLRKLSDNDGIKVDYIMIDTLDKQEDMDMLTQIIYEDFNEDNSQLLGVPTTYVIKDGNLVNKMQGAVAYQELVKEYNEHVKQ